MVSLKREKRRGDARAHIFKELHAGGSGDNTGQKAKWSTKSWEKQREREREREREIRVQMEISPQSKGKKECVRVREKYLYESEQRD
jgi:hypothetical protein